MKIILNSHPTLYGVLLQLCLSEVYQICLLYYFSSFVIVVELAIAMFDRVTIVV
jgi:hypothetical protein